MAIRRTNTKSKSAPSAEAKVGPSLFQRARATCDRVAHSAPVQATAGVGVIGALLGLGASVAENVHDLLT